MLPTGSAAYYTEPCAAAANSAGTLPECTEQLSLTGKRQAIACAGRTGRTCYVALGKGGQTYWLADHSCTAAAGTTVLSPVGDSRCSPGALTHNPATFLPFTVEVHTHPRKSLAVTIGSYTTTHPAL